MPAETIRLDVTRALSRAGRAAPTGVDRVERAWIRWAISDRWADAQFVARTGAGEFALDRPGMSALLSALDGETRPALDLRGALSLRSRPAVRRAESLLRRLSVPLRPADVYANVGHSNLSPATMARMRATGAARLVVKIHDIIPLEYPAFSRPDGPEKMRTRLQAAALADGLVFNSQDTGARALPHLSAGQAHVVAPLGLDIEPAGAGAPHDGFVCIGTIEPRKNHALLLDLWAAMDNPAPLHIVGQRGWMNEAVFARLDARPTGVIEHAGMADEAMRALLTGARALLFPSWAEGYGLPMAEALALGTPVIASDLPALREVGRAAATYCAPDDPAAWAAAIAAPPPRDAPALRAWKAPRWANHFACVDELLSRI